MSDLRNTQQRKVYSRRSRKGNQKLTQEENEPLWQFDEDNDVASIVCQELSKCVIEDPSVNLLSMNLIRNSSNADQNKSDVTLLLLSSITRKLGMKSTSDKFLNESDVVHNLFNKMGLEDNSTLNMFVVLVCTLSPEFVKTVEIALFTAMRRHSRDTTVKHTMSRVESALNGLSISEIADDEETAIAGFNANIRSKRNIEFVASSVLSPSIERTITPDDSASRRMESLRNDKGWVMEEDDLMAMIRDRKAGTHLNVEDRFPKVDKPITPIRSKDREGLGFADMMRDNDNESRREDKGKQKHKNVRNAHVDQKRDEILSDFFSGLQQRSPRRQVELETEDEPSILI